LRSFLSLGAILLTVGVFSVVLLLIGARRRQSKQEAFTHKDEESRSVEEELPMGPGFAPRARDIFVDPEVAQCLANMGLRSDASMEDVKQAYRKFVKKHHPDLKPGSPMASSEFVVVTKAYEQLQEFAQQGKFKRR